MVAVSVAMWQAGGEAGIGTWYDDRRSTSTPMVRRRHKNTRVNARQVYERRPDSQVVAPF